jgi:hypothetical protein
MTTDEELDRIAILGAHYAFLMSRWSTAEAWAG